MYDMKLHLIVRRLNSWSPTTLECLFPPGMLRPQIYQWKWNRGPLEAWRFLLGKPPFSCSRGWATKRTLLLSIESWLFNMGYEIIPIQLCSIIIPYIPKTTTEPFLIAHVQFRGRNFNFKNSFPSPKPSHHGNCVMSRHWKKTRVGCGDCWQYIYIYILPCLNGKQYHH